MTTHHQQGWGGTQPKARVEMLSASRILHPSLSISTKAGFLAKQANNTRLGPLPAPVSGRQAALSVKETEGKGI